MPLANKRITIGKIGGIYIVIDPSWFLIFILLTWSLAAGYFPSQVSDLKPLYYWAAGALASLGLFFSVILHELGHSFVAIKHGVPVKRIILFVFGGMSQLEGEPEDPKTEFYMAIVGPLISLILAGAFFLAGKAISPVDGFPLLKAFLGYLALVNFVLSVFNLFPGFPLDGGRVLRALLWHRSGDLLKATRIASEVGSGFGLALFLVGVFYVLLGNFAGLWYVLIGFFLRNAAIGNYQQTSFTSFLKEVKIEDVMTPDPVTVAPGVSLKEFVDGFILAHHHPAFPVMEGGRLRGLADVEMVKHVPKDMWGLKTVQDIYRPLNEVHAMSPLDAAADAMKLMLEKKTGRILVIKDEKLRGIVSRRDIMDYLTLKSNLFKSLS